MSRVGRFLSRISVRLLAFNILLVFLPAAGMLFLDTYERHLLEAQERTMGQEGRLLAAALELEPQLDAGRARTLLVQLGQRHQARLRVVDVKGGVVADSALLGPRREVGNAPDADTSTAGPRGTWLYRLGSLPVRVFRRLAGAPGEERVEAVDPTGGLAGPEVAAALAGRYGAATRLLPGAPRTVVLSIAIPIRIDGAVVGAAVVSQSTSRILDALYAVRLDVFRVFLASLAVALALTLVVATTISRPLARLRARAGEILDRRGRLRGSFAPSRRSDEIGELERALAELTQRLEQHLGATEAFAADLSHEFRNPLAAIRSATEMAREVEDATERIRFLSMIERDVARMERLLAGAREVSRIDALLEDEDRDPLPLRELLANLVDSFRLHTSDDGPHFALEVPDAPLVVLASSDRLTQVFENLLENAASFSPPGATVTVRLRRVDERAEVVVADQGPGIPSEHRDRIFSRFFSYRPGGEAQDEGHTGLGLAIVKAVVEGYGGSVSVRSDSGEGTRVVVSLPIARV